MVSSMAMKQRKLHPISTSTAANQTGCPDFCDPSCPDSCEPYADIYFMPPPLPPPPPPLSTDHDQQISPYVIIVVSLLASLFLFVGFYMIIVKYCSGRNRLRPPRAQSDGRDEEFLDENRGPAIDHHIWYINTVGLQPSVINSITVFKYKKGDPLIEGSHCAVCLSEFQEDETLRLLPKCNHAFHIPCIDTWLRSHTNCPLCRAGILSNTSGTPASNDRTSLNLIQEEEIQVENSEMDSELSNNWVNDGNICRNRGEIEAEVELPQVDDERKEFDDSKGVVHLNEPGVFSVLRGLEDKNIQPVRRSVSMDSSSAATISLTVASFCMAESEGNSVHHREDVQESNLGIVQTQDRANSRMNRAIGSLPIAQSLHKSPVPMKRSFSCGGRLFLSRYNRNTSSILPL